MVPEVPACCSKKGANKRLKEILRDVAAERQAIILEVEVMKDHVRERHIIGDRSPRLKPGASSGSRRFASCFIGRCGSVSRHMQASTGRDVRTARP
jgi:hypothetical protein